MTPKLKKLSATAKLALALSLFLTAFAAPLKAQVFPSEMRLSAGVDYGFLPVPQSDNIKISPKVFAGVLMEFKQLYALHLALQSSFVDVDNIADRTHPTLGFTYDLVLKLYRDDPRALITPIAVLGFSKEWSLVRTDDATVKQAMNDLTDWQFKTYIGIDFAPWESFHIKPTVGWVFQLAPVSFFEKSNYPTGRLSIDFAF